MKAMRALAMLATLVLAACGDGSVQSPDFTAELISLSAQVEGTSGTAIASTAAGDSVQLEAIGTFTAPPGSSDTTRRVDADWTSSNTQVATVDGDGKVKAVSVGTANVVASKHGHDSNPVVITVTVAELRTLQITLASDTTQAPVTSDTIARGTQREYKAVGTFSDGSKAAIPSNWTSVNPEVAAPATLPPDPASTRAIGVPQTAVDGASTTITAAAAQNSEITATLTITVSDAVCSTALRATNNYAATGTSSGLCVGCSVTTPEAVIDADDANFATLNQPLSLLGASVTLDVKPASGSPTPFPGGSSAGFVISRATSDLLGAELLSSVQVSTLLNGVVQESSDSTMNILQVDLLGMSLLPIGDIPSETASVSFLTTKAYDGLRLTYGGGVATALSTLRVFNACGTLVPPSN